MPGLDGPALYTEIKARWPQLADKVIFITGDTLSSQVQKLLTDTRRPVIEKPFMPAEVGNIVKDVVAGVVAETGFLRAKKPPRRAVIRAIDEKTL
jgi:DNA-binding NarL/FixJ family response regulator